MRTKVDYRTASREAYDNFCKKYPSLKVTFKQFENVIKTSNEMIRDYILETGDKFRLPFGFGDLFINKWKPKKYIERKSDGKKFVNLPIDWQKTRQIGKRVYHLNAHTDGFRFKWYWDRQSARFDSSPCYIFKPMRDPSRLLNKYLKKPDGIHKHIYKEWVIKKN